MLSYCLKYRENAESKIPNNVKTKNEKIMLLSKCAVYNSEKLKLIKDQEVRRLLSSLGIRTPLKQIPLLF